MAKITFSSISLENFGPFMERQTLDLSVTSSRSVILVKALNGSGKTTLLTALQIGLYGAKAISGSRRAEYEQLINGLQRKDAVGNARIDVGLIVDSGGARQEVTVSREWPKEGPPFVEEFSVTSRGIRDLEFTQNWDDFIDTILPAELAQLFLFDGEKIEALANPDRLPELLRRATETFLGIGGLDILSNDLKALERRSLLRNKDGSAEYEAAKAGLLEWEDQAAVLSQKCADLLQAQAATRNSVDQAQKTLEQYMIDAQRDGLGAYQQAGKIRTNVIVAQDKLKAARAALAESFADPHLPIKWLKNLWSQYSTEWNVDQKAQHADMLMREFANRDRRVLRELSKQAPKPLINELRKLLAEDLTLATASTDRSPMLQPGPDPKDVDQQMCLSLNRLGDAMSSVTSGEKIAAKAERLLGEVPAEEQLSLILSRMKVLSHSVAQAEQRLAELTSALTETQGKLTHVDMRLNAARVRLSSDFKDRALESKGLEAASRARRAMGVFKERLLASKATWLSEVITIEFKSLLRKQRLISRVIVDPATYRVTIEDTMNSELPMDRLSAGERQMLAIAVLSALIKERKGRFPVVVDTPLARLDKQHRTALIRRFFATVSHQVVVLSTDEEVDGAAYDALQPHTNREYVLHYDDNVNASYARKGGGSRAKELEAA